MKKRFSVYLAHPMINKTLASQDWKGELLDAIDHLPINITDPSKMGLKEKHYEDIVQANKGAIAKSDLVIAYVSIPSAGTSMEVYHACLVGIPVWVYSDVPVSAWIRKHATKMYHSLTLMVSDLETMVSRVRKV